jgi:hypothetical protein
MPPRPKKRAQSAPTRHNSCYYNDI